MKNPLTNLILREGFNKERVVARYVVTQNIRK